jgi:hypothetical protein
MMEQMVLVVAAVAVLALVLPQLLAVVVALAVTA